MLAHHLCHETNHAKLRRWCLFTPIMFLPTSTPRSVLSSSVSPNVTALLVNSCKIQQISHLRQEVINHKKNIFMQGPQNISPEYISQGEHSYMVSMKLIKSFSYKVKKIKSKVGCLNHIQGLEVIGWAKPLNWHDNQTVINNTAKIQDHTTELQLMLLWHCTFGEFQKLGLTQTWEHIGGKIVQNNAL